MSRKVIFRRRSLHRFHALDCIDLVRTVFALALFDLREQRAQHLLPRNTSVAVEWRGREERRRHEYGAVNEHERYRADERGRRRGAADAELHGELPHLPAPSSRR